MTAESKHALDDFVVNIRVTADYKSRFTRLGPRLRVTMVFRHASLMSDEVPHGAARGGKMLNPGAYTHTVQEIPIKTHSVRLMANECAGAYP